MEKEFFKLSDYLSNPASPAETVTYEYDEFGRQTVVTFDHGSGNVDVTTNTFDSEGRLTRQLTENDGTFSAVNYEYSRATGQLIRTFTQSTASEAGTISDDVRYTYDTLDRLSSVISVRRLGSAVAGSGSVDWINALGQTEVIAGEVTLYSYDLVGNLSRSVAPNKVVTEYTYDGLNRLIKQISYKDANTNNIYDGNDILRSSYEYELDLFGNRVSSLEKINSGPNNTSVVTSSFDWVYDSLGRLVEEHFDEGDNGRSDLDYTATYEFDLVGNRLTKQVDDGTIASTDEVFAYKYDRNNRLFWETFDDRTNGYGIDTTKTYEYGNGAWLAAR